MRHLDNAFVAAQHRPLKEEIEVADHVERILLLVLILFCFSLVFSLQEKNDGAGREGIRDEPREGVPDFD